MLVSVSGGVMSSRRCKHALVLGRFGFLGPGLWVAWVACGPVLSAVSTPWLTGSGMVAAGGPTTHLLRHHPDGGSWRWW